MSKNSFITGILTYPYEDRYEVHIIRAIKPTELVDLPCMVNNVYTYYYGKANFSKILDRVVTIFTVIQKTQILHRVTEAFLGREIRESDIEPL